MSQTLLEKGSFAPQRIHDSVKLWNQKVPETEERMISIENPGIRLEKREGFKHEKNRIRS